MDALNLALDGLTGGSSGSPLTSPIRWAADSLPRGNSASAPASTRDSAMAGVLELSAAVNALQQVAGARSSGDSSSAAASAAALQLPPLPPAPHPAKAPAIRTDAPGGSNIVFSDADADGDGTLIH